jgi:peptidoglycan/LPS O-acetylase OafA/YrhL
MRKIIELDGLRGILAVWVVVVHLLNAVEVDPRAFGYFSPMFGERMRVQIFCILSGFVICILLSRKRQSYRDFVMGRMRRIYPAYIVAFFLAVAISAVALVAVYEAPFQVDSNPKQFRGFSVVLENPLPHIFAHVTMLHGVIPNAWLPNVAHAFLPPAWNLSTEMQFYMIAPLLFLGLFTGPIWRRVAVLVVVLAVAYAFRDWPNLGPVDVHLNRMTVAAREMRAL